MIILFYASKKDLKASVGKSLRYEETSMFGDEFKADGSFSGANRPSITRMGREFFARITMKNGLIASVE